MTSNIAAAVRTAPHHEINIPHCVCMLLFFFPFFKTNLSLYCLLELNLTDENEDTGGAGDGDSCSSHFHIAAAVDKVS